MTMSTNIGRESGVRAAIAMLKRLERDCALAWACDPAGTERPMRNIVLECLDRQRGNREAVEGFCLAVTGFLAIYAGGSEPDVPVLHNDIRIYLARQAAYSEARGDATFQQFLAGASYG
jgi:hypothetical protein